MKRHLSEQLPLVFGHAPATGRDDLLVSDRLSAAISIVDHWPVWPSPVVIICGPVGSGKSHLAGIWREKAKIGVAMPGLPMCTLATSSSLPGLRNLQPPTGAIMATLAGMSPSIVTPLNKLIGYEAAARIAKHSVAKGITVREAVIDLGYVERGELTEQQLDEALDLLSMTRPPHA